MAKNIFETFMGGVVLIVALSFVVIAYQSGAVDTTNGYTLSAKFDRIDGLGLGSDVRVSGLKVGTVKKLFIDPKTYLANVELAINDEVKLPRDTSAAIVSDGLLGGKYLALIPGGSEAMFQDKDLIEVTQSAVNFEELIGKFMFGSSEDNGSEGGAEEDDIF